MSECGCCGSVPGTNLNCPVCGRLAPALAGYSPSLVMQFCTDFGVNTHTAQEVLAWWDEHGGGGSAGEDDARRLCARFRQAMNILVSYQQKQDRPAELRMSTRAMCLVLGFETAAGAREFAELGRKLGLGKATVNKCGNTFLDKLGMPKLPTQRDDQARQNMTRARQEQLRKSDDGRMP